MREPRILQHSSRKWALSKLQILSCTSLQKGLFVFGVFVNTKISSSHQSLIFPFVFALFLRCYTLKREKIYGHKRSITITISANFTAPCLGVRMHRTKFIIQQIILIVYIVGERNLLLVFPI